METVASILATILMVIILLGLFLVFLAIVFSIVVEAFCNIAKVKILNKLFKVLKEDL